MTLAVASLALVASVPLDRWCTWGSVEALANVELAGPAGPLHAYVARPAQGSGPFPLVVMIHEFWGLDEATISKAASLADDGYVVVAPDLMRGSRTEWLPSAIWQTLRTPDERVRDDLDAVFAAFVDQSDIHPDRVAVMGFCFGGRTALRYALERPQVAATAVFYGSVTDDAAALEQMGGPVLGVFGAEDTSIPLAEAWRLLRAFLQRHLTP
jgi:carboxymethylenebutenolidase